jgi:uncharacterized protein with NAD-binding domain and iron-sulfur cluster
MPTPEPSPSVPPAREKIAILGGGMAGLATAFALTSEKGWDERFEITIYQMGWRLGGKCASSRGPCARIEEHGIHGFLGSYWNTLPMMVACYDELNRPADAPLATFETAILRQDFGLLWEPEGRTMTEWAQRFPRNAHRPHDPADGRGGFERALAGVVESILGMAFVSTLGLFRIPLSKPVQRLFGRWAAPIGRRLSRPGPHPRVAAFYRFWGWLKPGLYSVVKIFATWRRTFMVMDHLFTMVAGALAEGVQDKGYDHLDGENFSAWLKRHGAHPATLASPLNLNFINMTYQYPGGDTSRPPQMSAASYVRWALQATSYFGSFIWRFAAGTGETLIAPLYLVLRARGVKFAFFHKVEALRLSKDRRDVVAVDIAVQATLKDPKAAYDPLISVKDLPSWPHQPLFDQLAEGPAMAAWPDLDLESYWTDWVAPKRRKLVRGKDFDRLVFAISIGAIPHLCKDLLKARQDWRDMVCKIPSYPTQAMQIWLDKDARTLGWDIHLKHGEAILSTTYLNPQNGEAEFSGLIPFEDWPPACTPKGLWYFCGLMMEDERPPPFSDHDYPRRQRARVKYQSIQYLQAGFGLLLPKATTNASDPPGDPVGLNFELLTDTRQPPGVGILRFDQQFWRANIDPTERYVASPPGSTPHRLKAWASGFGNLVIAGDWIYTGINVGSVEGAVMSGKLAAHALCGAPALNEIPGYLT